MIARRAMIGLAMTAAFMMSGPGASGQEAATGGPSPDDNVYIVRSYALPLLAVIIKIDGKKVTSLYNGQYTALHVDPGKHNLAISFPFIAATKGIDADIDIPDGRPIYIEFRGETSFGYQTMTRDFYLSEMQDPGAQDEITTCCKYKAPKSGD